MKSKRIILVALLTITLLSACGARVQTVAEKNEQVPSTSMFVEVESTLTWKVVYHRDTKVMYAVSGGHYNSGAFTVLLNPDGSPMLWEEDTK